jgi:hypothetical protein
MDFESIYRLQEAEAAPAQGTDTGLPPEMTASEEAMNIAMNQLSLVVKNFKNDNYIKTMMDFYDGKNMNESIESDTEHLTEAKKGSFKSYYKVVVKSVSNVQKKIKIAVIITIAALILAGVGGAALVSTLKNKKAEMKALKDNGASGDSTPTNKETEGNSLANPATQAQVQDQAQKVAANPETVQQSLKPADPQVVKSVINGNFGNAPERAQNLIKAGYDPISVQNAVNADPSAKAAPQAVEETPAPAEVTQVVKQEIESGELKTDDSGKVVPTVEQNGTDTETKAPESSGNNDAYNSWKNNPNNQKMLNNLTAQAKAAGQDPEAVMRDTFNNGGTVDALRTVQMKYGLNDISGSGVSDNKMAKTIGAANLDAYKVQQYQQIQNDPEVQAYLNFIKSDKKLGGQSLDVIGKKTTGLGAYTGLSEFKTDPTGNRQAYWTDKPGVTQQIKNGLKKIQTIAKTKKIPQ